MSIFKKEEPTPRQIIKKSRKIIKKAGKKRDALGEPKNSHFHSTEYKTLTGIMAEAYDDIELAEEEIKLAAAAAKTDARQKTTKIEFSPTVTVNSKKSKQQGVQISDAFKTGKGKKETSTAPKKSKLKTIVFWIVVALVAVALIGVTVKITNCVRDCQDHSSSTYLIQTI